MASLLKNVDMVTTLAFTVGFSLVLLATFADSSAVNGTAAETTIDSIVTEVGTYADWVGLIILLGVYIYMKKNKAIGN